MPASVVLHPPAVRARCGTFARRATAAAVAGLVVLSPACASGRGSSEGLWMVGMMGAMMLGGLVIGTGVMHGGPRGADQSRHDAADSLAAHPERFDPAELLRARALLELTDEQVAELAALRDSVSGGSLTREEAAHAAAALLRPVQRAAVSAGTSPPARPRHHR